MMKKALFFILILLVCSKVSLAAESNPALKASDVPLSSDVEPNLEREDDAENTSPAQPGLLRFDLTDCVRMAMRNNSEIRGAGYDIENAIWKLKEAQVFGAPVVEYSYEAAPVPTNASNAVRSFFSGDITMLNRVKFGFGVPLTAFGKIGLAQSLARTGIEAAQEKKNQKTTEIVLKVKQLYYGILLARDLKTMMDDALKKIDHEISTRETSDTPTDPVDLAKLKLTRFELLKRVGEVNRKGEAALEGLRIQSGVDSGVQFQIIDKHLRPVQFELKEMKYYLEEAKRYRPESRLLNLALKAKEDEYRLERRKLLPNLGFGAFFELGRTTSEVFNVGDVSDYNDPFNYTRAGFGLRLQGNFNWKESNSRIHQKEAEYYKMSTTKDYAEDGLSLDIKDAYLTTRQSKEDLDNSDKAYRLARQLVFLTKTNYDVGVGDKKDYADALQAYLLIKGRYYEAIFNYNIAVATLMSKVGYQPQF